MLDVATVGLFPFTAVSDSYVASGSFYGGAWIPPDGRNGPPPPDYVPPAPPQVYQDVSAYVPAGDQIVEVGHVQVVGHDDKRTRGQPGHLPARRHHPGLGAGQRSQQQAARSG